MDRLGAVADAGLPLSPALHRGMLGVSALPGRALSLREGAPGANCVHLCTTACAYNHLHEPHP
jgi:hypothetical protein